MLKRENQIYYEAHLRGRQRDRLARTTASGGPNMNVNAIMIVRCRSAELIVTGYLRSTGRNVFLPAVLKLSSRWIAWS